MEGFDKGDTVWYFTNNTGWRTGIFLRVVERGRKFGMYVIRRTADDREIMVGPDNVHDLNGTTELKTGRRVSRV